MTCIPPDPNVDFNAFLGLTDSTGKRSLDVGNYYGCLAGGNRHCMIALTGSFVGQCVPLDCTEADLLNFSSPIFSEYVAVQSPIVVIMALLTGYYGVTCESLDGGAYAIGPESQAVIAVFATLAVAVLLATLSVLARPRRPSPSHKTVAGNGGFARDLADRVSLTRTLPAIFGLDSHAPTVVSPPQRTANLSAMNGMRVLSISLVVLGHALLFMTAPTGQFANEGAVLQAFGEAAFQIVPSAEYAVDTFFVLSGTLASFLLLKGTAKALARRNKDSKQDSHVPASVLHGYGGSASSPGDEASTGAVAASLLGLYGYYAVHRIVRLLPCMLAMIAVLLYIVPLLGSGPFWRKGWESVRAPCLDHWWADALFINNFVPDPWGGFGDQCAGWLWYVATDTQLYLALPPFVWAFYFASEAPRGGLLHRWRWAAWAAGFAAAMSSVIAVVVSQNLTFLTIYAPPDSGDMSDYMYDKPWTRAPAFLCGVAVGQALWEWELGTDEPTDSRRGVWGWWAGCWERDGSRKDASRGTHERLLPEVGAADGSLEKSSGGERAIAVAPAATAADSEEDAVESSDASSSLHILASRLSLLILPSRLATAPSDATTQQITRVDKGATLAMALALAVIGIVFYLPSNAYYAQINAPSPSSSSSTAFSPAPYGLQLAFAGIAHPIIDASALRDLGGLLRGVGAPMAYSDAAATVPWSTAAQRAFTVVYRPSWAAAVAVMLYLCATGRGGCLGGLLGAKFWKPLATLSFGAYLLHPLVLDAIYYSVSQTPDYSPATFSAYYAGTVALCFVSSAVFHVLVEAPAAALESVMWKAGGMTAISAAPTQRQGKRANA